MVSGWTGYPTVPVQRGSVRANNYNESLVGKWLELSQHRGARK